MVSKEMINRPKLCFRVIRPRIIFIITRKIIFRCPFVHLSFSFIFLWFSSFFIPFSVFLVCSCSFLFFCGVSSTFFGTLIFQICLPASDILIAYSSRGDFSSPLPPSVGGDPWLGCRKKFTRLKWETIDNFYISGGMMKDGHFSFQT